MKSSVKISRILGSVFPAILLLASFGAPSASALTTLKQVQVSNGSRVDLLFDGRISRSQIKTEFFRDIIQISLNDVSVYPAKISSVSGGVLTKIFAYQYGPKLVRCRLSVKGNAETYKNRIVIGSGGLGGRMLTVRIETPTAAPAEKAAAPVIQDAGERALLDRVMKDKAPVAQPAQAKKVQTDTITEKSAAPAPTIDNTENRPVNLDGTSPVNHFGGTPEMPSPVSALGKLALVIGLFCGIAFVVKKFLKTAPKGTDDRALLGAIGRFARKSLSGKVMGSRKFSVEILANHHLGPKKSIAVIRVASQTMVIGITEQSINLISHLARNPDDAGVDLGNPDDAGYEEKLNALAELDNPPLDEVIKTPANAASPAGPAVFSKMLTAETAKPAVATPVANTKLAATTARAKQHQDVRVTSYGNTSAPGNVSAQTAMGLSGVRAQIRSKLEGLKQI